MKGKNNMSKETQYHDYIDYLHWIEQTYESHVPQAIEEPIIKELLTNHGETLRQETKMSTTQTISHTKSIWEKLIQNLAKAHTLAFHIWCVDRQLLEPYLSTLDEQLAKLLQVQQPFNKVVQYRKELLSLAEPGLNWLMIRNIKISLDQTSQELNKVVETIITNLEKPAAQLAEDEHKIKEQEDGQKLTKLYAAVGELNNQINQRSGL